MSINPITHLEELVTRKLQAGDAAHLTENDIAVMVKTRASSVEDSLFTAVTAGRLRRTRIDGQMAYSLPVGEPLGRAPAATPAPRKRGFTAELPPLDIEALPVRLEPLADGRAVSQPSKWTALFERLAKMPPSNEAGQDVFPTVEMPAMYGKAVSAAARKWSKQTGGKVRIKVMATAEACKVQRVA